MNNDERERIRVGFDAYNEKHGLTRTNGFRLLEGPDADFLVPRVQKILASRLPAWFANYPLSASGIDTRRCKWNDQLWFEVCEGRSPGEITAINAELRQAEFLVKWACYSGRSELPYIFPSQFLEDLEQTCVIATLARPIKVAIFPPYDVYAGPLILRNKEQAL